MFEWTMFQRIYCIDFVRKIIRKYFSFWFVFCGASWFILYSIGNTWWRIIKNELWEAIKLLNIIFLSRYNFRYLIHHWLLILNCHINLILFIWNKNTLSYNGRNNTLPLKNITLFEHELLCDYEWKFGTLYMVSNWIVHVFWSYSYIPEVQTLTLFFTFITDSARLSRVNY